MLLLQCLTLSWIKVIWNIFIRKLSWLIHCFNFSLTDDDTRSCCRQCRSRSDCTECSVWSLIYTVHICILDFNWTVSSFCNESVFLPKEKIWYTCIYLIVEGFNFVPNHKTVDWAKLKSFSSNKSNVGEMMISDYYKIKKNVVEKRELWLPAIAVFSIMFSKGSLYRAIKNRDCFLKG